MLGLSLARLRQGCRCVRKEKDICIWGYHFDDIYFGLCFCQRWVEKNHWSRSWSFQILFAEVITLATLRAIQGIGAAAMLPASVSPHFILFHFHPHMWSIQLGILAHAFPPSRARSLAFATFSSGAAVGAIIGSAIGGVLSEFTKYELSHYLPHFTSINLFDPDKHGGPRSIYSLASTLSSLLVGCFQ